MRLDPYKFISSLDTSGVRIPPGWVPYPDELTWTERLRQWWRWWRGISGRSLPRMDVDALMPDVKPPRANSKWGRSVPAPPTFVTPRLRQLHPGERPGPRPDVRPKPQPARHK